MSPTLTTHGALPPALRVDRSPRPTIRSAREARRLDVLGNCIHVLLDGKDTAGRLSMMILESTPGIGAPRHVHAREAETFTVLEGRYRFVVDGRAIDADPWTTIHAPIGVAHEFVATAEGTSKMLVVASASGIEDFFAEIDALDLPMPPSIDLVDAVARRYGIRMLVPSSPDAGTATSGRPR